MASFIPQPSFTGEKEGYVFKKGGSGLGYYLDVANTSVAGGAEVW